MGTARWEAGCGKESTSFGGDLTDNVDFRFIRPLKGRCFTIEREEPTIVVFKNRGASPTNVDLPMRPFCRNSPSQQS